MNWDTYFLNMLPLVAAKSKDKETQVGAIIVSVDNNIVSTGFNSLPRGLDDSKPERLDKPAKYVWIEHADRNAIYNAARIGVPLKGCRMYLPFYPCVECTKGIVSSGIVEVIIGLATNNARLSQLVNSNRYVAECKNMEITDTMFHECGVNLRYA